MGITAVGDPGRVERVEARVELPFGDGVGGLAGPDQGSGQVVTQGRPVRGRGGALTGAHGGWAAGGGGGSCAAGVAPGPVASAREGGPPAEPTGLDPLLRLHEASRPAPPAAAANRRNARRPLGSEPSLPAWFIPSASPSPPSVLLSLDRKSVV